MSSRNMPDAVAKALINIAEPCISIIISLAEREPSSQQHLLLIPVPLLTLAGVVILFPALFLDSIFSKQQEDMSIPQGVHQPRIRAVWQRNLHSEFKHIDRLKHAYPLISLDTEYPGSLPPKRTAQALSPVEYRYETLKSNVDRMKLIQVGFTLTNEHGELPMIDGVYCAWEFNFRDFNPEKDLQVKESIELLRRSGIDLEKNHQEGIDSLEFGNLIMRYGLVFSTKIKYITYAGDYDFAYLLKAITRGAMPSMRAEFDQKVRAFFGTTHDIQRVQHKHFNACGGLESFCEKLGVRRMSGAAHQAGSDSLITALAFHAIRKRQLENHGRMQDPDTGTSK